MFLCNLAGGVAQQGNCAASTHGMLAASRDTFPTQQVLLWKGWVLKQMLNDVQSRVGATATRAHVESPLRTELFVDSCSVRHQGPGATAARAHAKSPPLGSPSAHKAQRNVHATRLLRSHATAHLDLSPCAKRHVPAKKLLRSRAGSTLGSRSVRKGTCSIEMTVADSLRKHTWILLRAQRDMFRRKDCCVRTPQAHLDLIPCAP